MPFRRTRAIPMFVVFCCFLTRSVCLFPPSSAVDLYINMTKAPRLHVEGAVLGFKRGLRTQNNNISLIKIKGVDSKKDAEFYHGKKVAFITKYSSGSSDKKEYRVNWGKVARSHGSNGVVRCTFRRNLPPQAIGGRVRIMLYPSRVQRCTILLELIGGYYFYVGYKEQQRQLIPVIKNSETLSSRPQHEAYHSMIAQLWFAAHEASFAMHQKFSIVFS